MRSRTLYLIAVVLLATSAEVYAG
ncbi:MAG: hypothetical protein JWO56_2013, partial [Acidobacteria bacterium]|nr:hypothetical protein [Acidobacteriota bacterium]